MGFHISHINSSHVQYREIHISNRKQSYIINTGTWNNNTCNKHGDPYDRKIEITHACVTVICKQDMNVYDDHAKMNDHANMKCSSLCSDMPRSYVPRITIHDMTVFREIVSLRIGGLCLRNNKCVVS